jgi:hypothetical protein
MRVPGVSRRKVVLLVVAAFVGTVAWGLYTGHEALAGLSPFGGVPVKCYETSDEPLNEPVRLFDAFHPPLHDNGGPIPEGGEAVTVKGPHLICAPLIAKCFPETGRCQFFGQDGVGLADGPSTGLKCYKITPAGPPVNQTIPVDDQFGPEALKVGKAKFLCEPAFSPVFGPVP